MHFIRMQPLAKNLNHNTKTFCPRKPVSYWVDRAIGPNLVYKYLALWEFKKLRAMGTFYDFAAIFRG